MLLNVVVTPGKPNPNSNFRDGTCELWVLLPTLPHWEISFYRAQGGNGPRRNAPGTNSSGTLRESQANFKVGTVLGL